MTGDAVVAYRDTEFVIVATPTNYEPHTNFFDTSSVEAVSGQVVAVNKTATIIIKPTILVGFSSVHRC